jgi:hypothetical protein
MQGSNWDLIGSEEDPDTFEIALVVEKSPK